MKVARVSARPACPRPACPDAAAGRGPSAPPVRNCGWRSGPPGPSARTMAIRASNTPPAVRGSRLPVGSSARRMRGLLARARAMATRCCSPPDNCDGRWVSRLPRPSTPSSRAASTRRLGARSCRRSSAAGRHSPARRIPAADDGPDRQSRWCRGGCGCARCPAGATPPRPSI